MELRSRLRSCNVYVTTAVDLSKNCNLEISIQADNILFNYYPNESPNKKRCDSLTSIESLSDCYSEDEEVTTVISIKEFCQIIPNSMSGLKIDKNSITFRVLTEGNDTGSFYKELLAAKATNSTAFVKENLKINVKVHEDVKVTCENCSNIISESSVEFSRILELPSSNMDMSEWFCNCHGHSSNHEVEVTPNKTDFLYRLTYFLINSSRMSENTNKFNAKREVYHCNRCLAWLGMKAKDSVTLYNSTVKIKQEGNYLQVFKHLNPISDDSNVNDFIYTIEFMTKEFNLGLQYSVMCKMVLECTISASRKHFLLIWVMDKELQVLQNCSSLEDDKVRLRSNYLTKILYKIEESLNEEVQMWISDPTVATTEISKPMYCTGVDHLKAMSLKLPDSFRFTNGYTISYLKM